MTHAIVNYCQDCNFEIGAGLELCTFCETDPDRPLQIMLAPVGTKALGELF